MSGLTKRKRAPVNDEPQSVSSSASPLAGRENRPEEQSGGTESQSLSALVENKKKSYSTEDSLKNALKPGTALEEYLRKKKQKEGYGGSSGGSSGGQLNTVLNYNDRLG